MAKSSYDAPAARNAVRVIELLCESERPLGVREVARRLELNSNMVFRLMRTLHRQGWVVPDEDGTKYAMSLRPFVLVLFTGFMLGCQRGDDYFLVGTPPEKREQKKMASLECRYFPGEISFHIICGFTGGKDAQTAEKPLYKF